MHKETSLNRKCSVLLAAGTGVAVCLTGGGVQSAKVTGNIKASNGGVSAFAAGVKIFAFNYNVSWLMTSAGESRMRFSLYAPKSGKLNGTAGAARVFCAAHNAGVTISNGMAHGFFDYQNIPSSVSNKYFAVQFKDDVNARYGWLHVVSSNAEGKSVTLDKWGYENSGASIKTAAESVSTQKLVISGNRVQLRWANKNEDGVARYEVQSQGAAGDWKAVSSNTPGDATYGVSVPQGARCRLVVEMVDGATSTVDF